MTDRFRPRRLVYLGTPAIAVAPLDALVTAGFDLAAVVTRVDKRRGRGSALAPSPVKQAALRHGLPVHHRVDDVLHLGADLGIVVAFGQLIKPPALAALPMVNLHFSLLPRWRGAAPVERALLAGDDATGVCLMQLEEGLDTGPVYACAEVPIGEAATGDSLRNTLVDVGARLLVDELRRGLGRPTAQVGEPTYAAKLSADDLRIDWSRPAAELDRLIRLGGAWTWFRGKRLKVIAARPDDPLARGDAFHGADDGHGDRVGGLQLLMVQSEGKAPMTFDAFARGARPAAGERLGVAP